MLKISTWKFRLCPLTKEKCNRFNAYSMSKQNNIKNIKLSLALLHESWSKIFFKPTTILIVNNFVSLKASKTILSDAE